jgi:hypothetical protein
MTHPFSVKIVDMGAQTPLLEPSSLGAHVVGLCCLNPQNLSTQGEKVTRPLSTVLAMHVVSTKRTQGRVSYYWFVKFALLLLLHCPLEQTLGPGDADVNVARLITEV